MFPFVRPAIAPAYCLALALLAFSALGIGRAAQAQTVTLHLSQNSIAEMGGSATVTATVSPASPTPFTVEVSAQAIVELRAENNRIELSPNRTLTFAANATSSTGTVTITAINNDGHTEQFPSGVTVSVAGTVSGETGVTGPADVRLAIIEDDGIGIPADRTRPELVMTSDGYGGTVSDRRMVLTFSEELNTNKLDEHSFRYRVNGGRYLAPDSAAISGNSVIVTLREPVNKGDIVTTVYKPPLVGTRSPVLVGSGDIFLDLAVKDLAGNPLYHINRINLRNDTKPRVELALTPAAIDENGGTTTVTATVPEAQAAPFTVTVSVSPADGVGLSSNTVLSFAANATTSTGEVTIAAVDNDAEAANPEVTVSGTLNGASDVLPPLDVTLAIRDDEAPPPQTGAAPETLAQAWLARFGRTAAAHVADAIAERLNGSGSSRATLAGRPLLQGGTRKGAGSSDPAARLDALRRNGRERWQRPAGTAGAHALTDRELLLGSAFLLNLSDSEGAAKGEGLRWTAWGRAAAARFDGAADGYSLDGDVTTVTLGADGVRGRWLAGLALAHTIGAGDYRGRADTTDGGGRSSGKVESSVTSVHPYLRFQASEHLSLWGILGFGKGALTLETERAGNRRHWNTGTEMWMAAAGARGVLVAASDTGGFELAARTDAQFMRMSSASTTGAAESGTLAAARAETSRVRLAVDGSYRFELEGGRTLVPSLEVGLRHDGGDAETGVGIEVGGSVRYADPKLGLTVAAKMRGLIAHEDTDYTEWGAGASLRIDPGAAGRGMSLTLSPAWGAATGRTGRLRSLHDVRGLAANDPFRPAAQLEAEAAYGLAAFGGRGAMTPFVGMALAEAGDRTWRTGIRWTLRSELAFGVEGTRREAANEDAPDHGIAFRAAMRW